MVCTTVENVTETIPCVAAPTAFDAGGGGGIAEDRHLLSSCTSYTADLTWNKQRLPRYCSHSWLAHPNVPAFLYDATSQNGAEHYVPSICLCQHCCQNNWKRIAIHCRISNMLTIQIGSSRLKIEMRDDYTRTRSVFYQCFLTRKTLPTRKPKIYRTRPLPNRLTPYHIAPRTTPYRNVFGEKANLRQDILRVYVEVGVPHV